MVFSEMFVSPTAKIHSKHASTPTSLRVPNNLSSYKQVKHSHRPGPTFGPYLVLQTLGEGEFAKVKLGIEAYTGQEVAIKLIRKMNINTKSRMEKIKREITILKSLNHPNIVKLFEVIESDKHIGIIIEYACGGELFDHILAHRYLKEREACRLFSQLISGVSYMHKRNIVHRDLKLENLLLDHNRNIIVTDFGFANRFSGPLNDLMATSCGSPCYAAPELVVSEEKYTGSAVDIWSCGVILYAMLCGYLPFDDDPENPDSNNINRLYKYILSTPLLFPDYVGSDARDLLRHMLVPDPTQRWDMDAIMAHRWLLPYAHTFAVSNNRTKGVDGHEVEKFHQPHRNTPSGSSSPTEIDWPPKRYTIQVEYSHSSTQRAARLASPKGHFGRISEVTTICENDGNDPIIMKVKPQELPMTSTTMTVSSYDKSHTTRVHYEPSKKPKSHNHIRPKTVHFPQRMPQPPTDSPSVVLTCEESRGLFIDSGARTPRPKSLDTENMCIVTSQILAALDVSPKVDGLTARADKRKGIKSMYPSILIGSFENSNRSTSSNAARKVMNWFRKKSLGVSRDVNHSIHISGHNECSRLSQEFRLRIHSGAIDQNAITSRPPIDVFRDIKRTLFTLGIEIKKEAEMWLKCTRCKRKIPDGLVTHRKSTNSFKSIGTKAVANTANTNNSGRPHCPTDTPSYCGSNSVASAARKRTGSAFTRFLKLGTQQDEYPTPAISSPDTLTIQPDPIYGDEIVDPGEEINFVIELCQVKDFGNLYIIDIRRRKGNLWSYKFLYHTILERLNLQNTTDINGLNMTPSNCLPSTGCIDTT